MEAGLIIRKITSFSLARGPLMNQIQQRKLLAYKNYSKSTSITKPDQSSPIKKTNLLRKIVNSLLKTLLVKTNIFYSKPYKNKVDILFLHSYPGGPKRIVKLTDMLQNEGISVQNKIFSPIKSLLRRNISKPIYDLHKDLVLPAACAKYIVEKYQPKVLVTFTNSSLISPFIKKEMHGRGSYVNISHAVSAFGGPIIDFDYYFLLGKSSMQNMYKKPVRIGNTKAVLAGSPFMDFNEDNNANFINNPKKFKNILYFSNYATGTKSYEFGLDKIANRNAKIVIEWAQKNSDFKLFVKPHPLEDPSIIRELSKGTVNIKILDKSISFKEALKDVPVVINTWSNASIEAAMFGRPSVILNDSDMLDDYLHLEKFFPLRAKDVDGLTQRISQVINNYEFYVSRAKDFLFFHIDRSNSIEYITECLVRLCKGEKIDKVIPIKEELKGLEGFL